MSKEGCTLQTKSTYRFYILLHDNFHQETALCLETWTLTNTQETIGGWGGEALRHRRFWLINQDSRHRGRDIVDRKTRVQKCGRRELKTASWSGRDRMRHQEIDTREGKCWNSDGNGRLRCVGGRLEIKST